MYRLAWIMVLNGKQSGPLQFSRDGKRYGEIDVAIVDAELLNDKIATLEYCVIGSFTREVLWCRARSRINDDAVARECMPAPSASAGSQS